MTEKNPVTRHRSNGQVLWLQRRKRAFLIFGALTVGLALAITLALLRDAPVGWWMRILDWVVSLSAGVAWGHFMWEMLVKHYASGKRHKSSDRT